VGEVTEAIVLRRQALRDTQDLLVLFTPEGRKDCVARVSAKRSGLLEPLTCVNLSLQPGRSLAQLQEVTLERVYTAILGDLDRLSWAGYWLALWQEAFPGECQTQEAYQLLRLTLEALDVGMPGAWLSTWCELRVLSLLGCAPHLGECLCGQVPVALSSPEGAAVCRGCGGQSVFRPGAQCMATLAYLQRLPLLRLGQKFPPPDLVSQLRRAIEWLILQHFPSLGKNFPRSIYASIGD
jgi:DNA repair protein RecO